MPPPTVVVVVEVLLAIVTDVVVDVVVVVVVGNGQLSHRWRTFRDVSLHDKGTSIQSFLSVLLRVTTASLRIERSVARQNASTSRVCVHFPRSRGTSVRHSAKKLSTARSSLVVRTRSRHAAQVAARRRCFPARLELPGRTRLGNLGGVLRATRRCQRREKGRYNGEPADEMRPRRGTVPRRRHAHRSIDARALHVKRVTHTPFAGCGVGGRERRAPGTRRGTRSSSRKFSPTWDRPRPRCLARHPPPVRLLLTCRGDRAVARRRRASVGSVLGPSSNS
jgi:hypothetical protein